MSKGITPLIAAIAALALLGGCTTSGSPANQAYGGTGGYGMPGATQSDSGSMPATSAPKTNNTLATPGVKSPAASQ